MKKILSFLIVAVGLTVSCMYADAKSGCEGRNCAGRNCQALADGNEKPGELPALSQDEIERVHELAAKVDPKLKAEFDRLHSDWYRAAETSDEIRLSSAVGSRNGLPQFKAMVDLGPEILPLVVEQMLDPDKFFTVSVYEALLGSNPTQEAWCQKRARQYVKAWLAGN